MFEVNRILKVPPQAEIRHELREVVRLFVSQQKIVPPTTLENLEIFAKGIVMTAGMDMKYLDFTIVLLGNEIWRETVRATPYHRRLLLLPQCLRNDQLCSGIFDELGLICSGCKNCNIDSILDKADKLGYTTLVAEGTTVAIGLVEEGAIDAVIGVSCMSVLQRSFEPVTRYALPGIGIPLLGDGCSNTAVDFTWLFEEMENFSGINFHTPLSVSLLKGKVADYFQPPVLNSFFTAENETERLSLHVMSMGGQRIRPLLAVMAYNAYCDTPSEETQKEIAIVIECFHKASLVHDDIEDGDEFRYGKPVLHRSEGVPVAINVGDYLIGKGYSLLSRMQVEADILAECLSVVATSHVRLSEGQGADLLLKSQLINKSVDDVLQIFRLKTGEAVKVALLTGAIAGKASRSERDTLGRFAELFGVAYQIRDDMQEYKEKIKTDDLFDFPFLLVLLQKEMHHDNFSFLQILEKNDVELFRIYCSKYTIEKKADEYLHDYLADCYNELDNLYNQKLRLGLYGIMGKVFKLQNRG